MNTDTIDLDLELSDSSFSSVDLPTAEVPVTDTVVTDDDLDVTPVLVTESKVQTDESAPKAERKTSGRGRGRTPSADVLARRDLSAKTASEVIRTASTPLSTSQIVREVQARGVDHKSVWTDVYAFLISGSHDFVEAPSTGSRTKWTVRTENA